MTRPGFAMRFVLGGLALVIVLMLAAFGAHILDWRALAAALIALLIALPGLAGFVWLCVHAVLLVKVFLDRRRRKEDDRYEGRVEW